MTWTDELLSQSTELRTTLAGLGISRGQCDQLFQDVAGQFRARMPSAAELRASIDADRLSGKVGIPVSVVRSAVAALARILEGKAGPMGAPTAS
ncbi:MAG: hypothetical protein NXH85_10330 [Pseudomonadaceae bacterium]|nr:hypothetical protein [Pseudomonadaceae bacterium]